MALLSPTNCKKRTLEYLVSDISKKHETNDIKSMHSDNQQKKRKNFTKHHNGPPLIPPSPKGIKPDSSSQTELILKNFVLEAANESWLEHTMKKSEFRNRKAMKEKMREFGVNTVKYEYQSLIQHTNINTNKQITELMEEGKSMHIVSQVADIGCPLVANPSAKRGCWCIEHYKKQQKKQICANQIQIVPNSHSQTAMNMMEYLKMKSAIKQQQQKIATTTTVDQIQNNLILHARSQQYVPSNRMQQIRMQQMLLNARTGTNTLLPTTTSKTIKPNLTKVRTHKDTIVFNNDDKNGQPPTKRRKKSRFGSK